MRRPACTTPQTSAMYSFSTSRSWNCRASSWCAASFLATTITPDVPRSRRCTMPGRSSPPMPLRSARWCSSALTSVPEAWPAPGWTTMPAGLFDHGQVLVLVQDVEGQRLAADGRSGRGVGQLRRRTRSPSRSAGWPWRRRPGATVRDEPSAISFWSCDRECAAEHRRPGSGRAAGPRARRGHHELERRRQVVAGCGASAAARLR